MFQTSEEVIHWINNRLKFGIKPGLKRMEWFMDKLDHPERRLKTVHIGGTNGKGSTTTFLRSILQAAGYRVGTFTSPYVEKFNERISINGEPIADSDLVEVANIIKPLVDEIDATDLAYPTEFEIITIIGFYYFAYIQQTDIVLVEVGLGGRLDSTNIIHPILSIITNVGYDHMNILGSTIEEIASEKAGIIKIGVPLITGIRDEKALAVIRQTAKNKKAPIYGLFQNFSYEDYGASRLEEQFSVQTLFKSYPQLTISMLGAHQIENATIAVMAATYLKTYQSFIIEESHLKTGLKKAHWPGRFEILSKKPFIIIDGAHNIDGTHSLIATLKRHLPMKKGTILFTALKDKQYEEIIEQLDKTGMELAFTEFEYPRATTAEQLYSVSKTSKKLVVPNWRDFLQEKIYNLKEDELFVCTGSLYFISEVKPYLKNLLNIKY
ncbi:bifunctional folylpolyglutamate synthase/dihydrofolate synthase [Bacillus kwashiorkori]|uniref:bifunctional folylpolyglutamate synthase/dihydrofolate synthase n=1 Tax=Bacillus kwashiorkori TaxID=1522318 RepID=UPI000784E863|nr:folylpolyglutamate synthase/dihydrofolate synthase family protein [Bacillus kwashiorkori]